MSQNLFNIYHFFISGHSLGLFHSTAEGALMNPYYDDSSKMVLSADDILGIQSLYGKNELIFLWDSKKLYFIFTKKESLINFILH